MEWPWEFIKLYGLWAGLAAAVLGYLGKVVLPGVARAVASAAHFAVEWLKAQQQFQRDMLVWMERINATIAAETTTVREQTNTVREQTNISREQTEAISTHTEAIRGLTKVIDVMSKPARPGGKTYEK